MSEYMKPSPRLAVRKGDTIYRACCMEEVALEPGRVVAALVVGVGLDGHLTIDRIWPDGTKTKPWRIRADWTHAHGWRATEAEAIEAGQVYLRRQIEDGKRQLETATTALAALDAKAERVRVDGRGAVA